jgi:hypothetical protein
MTPKQKAINLMDDIYVGLEIKHQQTAKKIAIYLAHSHVWETLELDRITFWKQVVTELEKLC